MKGAQILKQFISNLSNNKHLKIIFIIRNKTSKSLRLASTIKMIKNNVIIPQSSYERVGEV